MLKLYKIGIGKIGIKNAFYVCKSRLKIYKEDLIDRDTSIKKCEYNMLKSFQYSLLKDVIVYWTIILHNDKL